MRSERKRPVEAPAPVTGKKDEAGPDDRFSSPRSRYGDWDALPADVRAPHFAAPRRTGGRDLQR